MELGHFGFAQYLAPACRFLLSSLALALCFVQASSATNEPDKLALLAFKAAVEDPYRGLASWNDTIGFCGWYGVTCGPRHQRVTVSRLKSLGLSGPISPHIGNLSFLSEIHLENNSLVREIPPQVGRLRHLRLLQLDNNSPAGKIPRNMSACSKLEVLSIAFSQLTGVIPTELGSLSKLRVLSFCKNALSGNVPSSFGNLSSLQVLELTENNLGGGIPEDLGRPTSLTDIIVPVNRLSGTIPSSLLNLSSLLRFDVLENQIQGSLPADLGLTLPNLQCFAIAMNKLEGPIPPSVSNWTKLDVIEAGENKLSGKVPSFGNMPWLWLFGIFDNQLGSGNYEDLSFVCSLTNSTRLEFFQIQRNRLGGALPKCIGMLPLEGVFKNATATSIIGNDELCGGLPAFHLPKCISKRAKRRKIHILVSSASATFVILGISLVLVFLYLHWLKKKVKEPISTSTDDSCPNISYRALLKATDDFSSMNLIDVGNFGSVYKGILKENGTTVAVKVLHLVHRGALKSFLAECEALKNVRHRNLLKILTVCSSIDHQQNDFKALVYEYMENGSLERWLHPNPTPSHRNEPTRTLNFFQRINIAIDVASALDYLHHQCHIPIIHCDLKPSNILLDAEMVAHVGDFGLAKFLPGSSFDTVANRTSSVGIRGTIGYAPPEYTMGCKVSREGDVYDYGILLLEMFTGLSPTNDTFRDNLTLHSFVAEALPERVLEITDRILLQERENHSSPNSPRHWLSESDGIFQECLVTVYNIGVVCSDEVPGRRMSISGATNQLRKIRERLFARG
ncbi:putative receptor-like protein kinase At3g47110 [Rhodamnia argentea]|uniref:Receptor-like protein kinase At3g47110 n=1 Tax=Rhodamnia argentea TaxID=178133 RepID=A0ABM3HVV0_9MYRT|nr:putative receptor-like protein kinase At3g47110 [Rhodamnia argentea]